MVRVPVDLPLRCRCGHVRGVAHAVSPFAGFRLVCYCKDCQPFARVLKRPDVLDAAGGTDIFQMPPGRLKLTAGTDAVRSLRFSGKVFRWYADCCRTPIGNTAAGPRFPLVGLIHSFMSQEFMSDEAGRRSRDEILGPPLCRIYERSASGPLPADAPPPASLGMLAQRAARVFGWLVAARAWSAEPVLRRANRRATLRPAPDHAGRARAALNLPVGQARA